MPDEHAGGVTFDLEEAVAVLARTPDVLSAMLRGLPEVWIHTNEGPETFSPFDVVGHLIHGDRTDWIARARIILEEGTSRPFEPFDRFAQFDGSKGKSLDELLDTFAALRAENVAALRALPVTPDTLAKKGRHPAFGEVTLAELLTTWVAHDLSHLGQIARVMAKRYREQVGPWRVYLPLLDR